MVQRHTRKLEVRITKSSVDMMDSARSRTDVSGGHRGPELRNECE